MLGLDDDNGYEDDDQHNGQKIRREGGNQLYHDVLPLMKRKHSALI